MYQAPKMPEDGGRINGSSGGGAMMWGGKSGDSASVASSAYGPDGYGGGISMGDEDLYSIHSDFADSLSGAQQHLAIPHTYSLDICAIDIAGGMSLPQGVGPKAGAGAGLEYYNNPTPSHRTISNGEAQSPTPSVRSGMSSSSRVSASLVAFL